MKKILGVQIIAVAAVLMSSTSAYADLTTKMTMIRSAVTVKGKALSAHEATIQKNLLATCGTTEATVYQSDNKVKVVSPTLISIRDLGSHTQTWLAPRNKTKWVGPFSPSAALMRRILRNRVTNFVNMKESKNILGYRAHLTKLYSKDELDTTIHYFWSTWDVPTTESIGLAVKGQNKVPGHKFTGIALKVTAFVTKPRFDIKTTDTFEVTALSTALIPASTFKVPDDYKTIAPPKTTQTPPSSYESMERGLNEIRVFSHHWAVPD